jgi:hypothetical protein
MEISFLRSSLFHIYYTRLYSVLHSSPTLSFLWMCPLETVPSPYLMNTPPHQSPHWAPPNTTCMAKLLNLTGSNREWETKTHTHKDIKLGSEGLHVPGGTRECLPKPECLFYRSVQGNESSENQLTYVSNSFDLT